VTEDTIVGNAESQVCYSVSNGDATCGQGLSYLCNGQKRF